MEEVVKSLKNKYRKLGKEKGIKVVFPRSEKTIILQYEKWSIASYPYRSFGYFHVVIECFMKKQRMYKIPDHIHFLIPFLLVFWKECSRKLDKPFFTLQDEIIKLSQIDVKDIRILPKFHRFSERDIPFLLTGRNYGQPFFYFVETEVHSIFHIASQRKEFFNFLEKLKEKDPFFNFYFVGNKNDIHLLTEETKETLTWGLEGSKNALYNSQKELVICFEDIQDAKRLFLQYLDKLKKNNRLQHILSPSFLQTKYFILETLPTHYSKHKLLISKLSTLFTMKEFESHAAQIVKKGPDKNFMKTKTVATYRYSWFPFLQKQILIVECLNELGNPKFYDFDNEKELILSINKHEESTNKKASV